MRARLAQSRSGISFRAICDAEMVVHLKRVITWAGGTITEKEKRQEGIILHINK